MRIGTVATQGRQSLARDETVFPDEFIWKLHDMRQRRFLPPIGQLTAFDAVIRHGSVTDAAAELSLTQSSVSRLIQSLETRLGVPLFLRQKQRLVPTEPAICLQPDIARALDLIQRATMAAIANPGGGTLSLAVLPTFGAHWLGPRLGRFLGAHPGVSVNLTTRIRRFSFEGEGVDAAIFFGAADWPGARHLKLFDERLTACATPGFLAQHPIAGPEDMTGLPRLQLETRTEGWTDWCAAQGVAEGAAPGMLMDQFSMMIQAAISGLGIALLPDYLARAEIDAGRLIPVLRPGIPARGAYWLAWPEEKESYGPLIRFRDWLAAEVAG